MSTETLFEKLNKVNVNDKTEKKGKFTYLSWAFAWGELKKVAPDAKVTVYHNEKDNMPYFESEAGVIVKVGVEVNGVEHISFLPLMDFKNKSISKDSFDMMDVNKAIQRATVKAIGLHGLGLYIYAGEDLPEDEQDSEPKKTSTRKASTKNAKVKEEVVEEEQNPVIADVENKKSETKRRGFRRRA
jgi:hypothetical protein